FPLVLFHLTAPDTLPPTNAAFILPPEGNTLFPLGKATSQLQVTQWATAHPLTAYVTFSLLSPPYAQAFLPVSWCKPVLSATVGPLVLAGERDGRRYAAVGFDLLPYLGKKNLPTSILTLNLPNAEESRLGRPLRLGPLTPPAPLTPETTGQPLWPWLLVAALFLLGLEWWCAVRSGETVQTA